MNKFRCLFVAVLLGLIQIASAQSAVPQLLGNAGGSASAGGYDIDWSLGETLIGPSVVSDITSGFQEYDTPLPVALPGAAAKGSFSIQQFQGKVKLILDPTQTGYSVQLRNGKGRTLAVFTANQGQREMEISTLEFSGMILMNVSTPDRQIVQGFKILGGK